MELKDIIAKLSTAVAVLDSGSAATLRRGVFAKSGNWCFLETNV